MTDDASDRWTPHGPEREHAAVLPPHRRPGIWIESPLPSDPARSFREAVLEVQVEDGAQARRRRGCR